MWLPLLMMLACATAGVLAAPQVATAKTTNGGRAQRSAATASAADFEAVLLARADARRVRHGCRPLRLETALALAARQHSARMAARGELSHQLAGEPSLGSRATAAGYTGWRMLAENLAWGQTGPAQVFRDWVASPSHRANLDNCRLRDAGIGVVLTGGRPWVTADFGRRPR